MTDEINPGFSQPITDSDSWAKGLYIRSNLGETPTLAQVEPIATELLGSGLTIVTGAEMVLGRIISHDEFKDSPLRDLMDIRLSGRDRFACLLMIRATEQMEAGKLGR